MHKDKKRWGSNREVTNCSCKDYKDFSLWIHLLVRNISCMFKVHLRPELCGGCHTVNLNHIAFVLCSSCQRKLNDIPNAGHKYSAFALIGLHGAKSTMRTGCTAVKENVLHAQLWCNLSSLKMNRFKSHSMESHVVWTGMRRRSCAIHSMNRG